MAWVSYNAQGILSNLAIGDWLGLPTALVHIYGHIKAIRKSLDKPEEIDTKAEFVGLASEFTHALEDGSEIIPGDWDDAAAARVKSLVLSDEGSDLLFSVWKWWFELPEPPTPEAVGEQLTTAAKQIVDPA